MFKATHFFKTICRLSEVIQKTQIKIVNTPKVCQNSFVRVSNFCTHPVENSVVIEGINEDININDLTSGDPDLEKKLRILVLEADVLRQDGARVPELSFLKKQHWKELLNKPTRSQRKKYLEFLFKIEKKKDNIKLKKDKKREERENRPEYVGDGHIRYGLNYNTFMLRIYDTTINQLYNNGLINAMKFGQKLVVDCGYDNHMISRETNNCAKQLMYLFSNNRMHKDPFDLHLCNALPDNPTMQALHKHIATMYEPWFPLNIHPESYLELFPKKNLVYLTPHCREEIKDYDHDAIYIIGGIVDKMNNDPLSLAKAKKEGLKMAKLPLDRYLQWGSGSGKSLTLDCMVNILLDVKTTGDWQYALRHVPRRKVVEAPEKPKLTFSGNRHSLRYDKDDDTSTKAGKREKSLRRERSKEFIKQLLNNR